MYVRSLYPDLFIASYMVGVGILPVSQPPINCFDRAQSPGILIIIDRSTLTDAAGHGIQYEAPRHSREKCPDLGFTP